MQTKVLVADQYPIIELGILNSVKQVDPSATLLPMVKNGEELFNCIENNPPNILFLELDLPKT